MKQVLTLLFLLLPGFALAQTYPALHDVTGVAADDVLNVRTAPSAGAEKIGELAPTARDIEVIATRDGWGLVNMGERAGWTSLRYLARQDGGDYMLTRRLRCFGTEPFWTLDITQGQSAGFSMMAGGGTTSYLAGLLQRSENVTDRMFLRASPLIAVITRGACNDGMSDSQYGLTADVFPDPSQDLRMFSGCCTLVSD